MSKANQNWSIGSIVKVGFLSLKVIQHLGNETILESTKGVKYSFKPYCGLVRL